MPREPRLAEEDHPGAGLDLAEDAADIQAAEEARAEMRETGATPIPWEQIKADPLP
jgi:hypothetical protein